MTALMTDLPTVNPHQDIEELLPWYANDTLTPDERLTVERHLEQCPACRTELAQCRTLATRIHSPAEEAWRPPADHFDRLMADIDRLTSPPAPTKSAPTKWQRILEGWRATPALVRWTLAFESLAVAGLLLALLPATLFNDPGYETLSASDPPVATGEPRLRVAFAERMTVGELRTLLRDISGQIVAGPSALGVYTVAVTGDERPAETQNRAVTALRAHEHVRLAEPLAPH